ncbi:FIG01269488: protein, clustered with ribosomal protein L32p [hydrothermal vent metagenome]|uniref:Large ribosomal RNA subunit accumulation protein YceD n=1 Tax=hydrothermal vent metagenome TaxID=652676 RepID=A0A3B0ZDB8_9ZZZZ
MRAMSDQPSTYIEPFVLANNDSMVERQVPLNGMQRLAGLVVEATGEAAVSLHFGADQLGLRVMQGTVAAPVVVRCERCLKLMTVDVVADVNVGLVKNNEQAENLPGQYEPLLLESDEPVSLTELVEDELILSLPIAPRHEMDAACVSLDDYTAEDEPQEEKKNPFAALAALKEKH